jgi:hypothetical protein
LGLAFALGIFFHDLLGSPGALIAAVVAMLVGVAVWSGASLEVLTRAGRRRREVARGARGLLALGVTPEKVLGTLHRNRFYDFNDLWPAAETVLGLPQKATLRLVLQATRVGPDVGADRAESVLT